MKVRSSAFRRENARLVNSLPAKAGTTNLRAFTLVEVILAVAIAAGLLMVAISFYQRSAELRKQLLEESERLATIRLMMDRLSGDLRTAFAEPRQGFTGTSDSMRFVHAGSPTPGNLLEGSLKLVSYGVVTNAQGTNATVIGFNRMESPLVEMWIASTTNREPVAFNGGMDLTTMTNRVEEPLTRAIRYVQFRYFNGIEWLDFWSGVDLPLGVEVLFGPEPRAIENEIYPFELYRRMIFVPAGKVTDTWEEFP